MYNDARKRANSKYQLKFDCITVRAEKGIRQRWGEVARSTGKSLNQYMIDAIEKQIAADTQKDRD